jgi:anti-sigma B factor antagonist
MDDRDDTPAGPVGAEASHPLAGPDFKVAEVNVDELTVVIALSGEVDLYTVPSFKERVAAAITRGKRRLVIDLSEVRFMDSTALGVLVGAQKRLRPLEGALAVVLGGPDIQSLFEISGLERVFALYPTREAALRGVAGGP